MQILKNSNLSKISRLIAILFLTVLASGWACRNFVKFGNPTYPYRTPFIGNYLPSAIDVEKEIQDLQRPEFLLEASSAKMLLFSVFELSRFVDNGFKWNMDQAFPGGVESPHFRLGGWSLFTVVILMLMLIQGIRYGAVKEPWCWACIFFALFIMANIPQGHEMRYFMAVPFTAAFLLVYRLNLYPKYVQTAYKLLILISAIHVYDKQRIPRVRVVDFSKLAPEKMRAAWAAYDQAEFKRPLCGGDQGDAILLTGPSLREYPVRNEKDCDGYFVR